MVQPSFGCPSQLPLPSFTSMAHDSNYPWRLPLAPLCLSWSYSSCQIIPALLKSWSPPPCLHLRSWMWLEKNNSADCSPFIFMITNLKCILHVARQSHYTSPMHALSQVTVYYFSPLFSHLQYLYPILTLRWWPRFLLDWEKRNQTKTSTRSCGHSQTLTCTGTQCALPSLPTPWMHCPES